MAASSGEDGWRKALARHPKLAAWAVLALGMVIILLVSARGAGLQAGQMAALAVITTLVAGLCVWIIGWE